MNSNKVKFTNIYSNDKEKSDEYYTPSYALYPLLEHLPKDKVIWECTDTSGSISSYLREKGYDVVSTADNFFSYNEPQGDIIVTNPPYSLKTKFLEHSYRLNIPFALLLPLTSLEGSKRQELYIKYGINLILFNKRIQFRASKKGAWFATAWFTHGISLPYQLNFFEFTSEQMKYPDKELSINRESALSKFEVGE